MRAAFLSSKCSSRWWSGWSSYWASFMDWFSLQESFSSQRNASIRLSIDGTRRRVFIPTTIPQLQPFVPVHLAFLSSGVMRCTLKYRGRSFMVGNALFSVQEAHPPPLPRRV